MITSISIENFKGIGPRVTIPLKPITLLFGPNSAGKSTILHAIHYAREVLERNTVDADRTLSGGPFVRLGGFPTLVHNHDATRAVTLAFELRRTDRSSFLIPQLGQWQAYEGVSGGVTSRMTDVERVQVEFSV